MDLTRRRLLAVSGVAASGLTAGCAGVLPGSSGGTGSTPTETATPEPTPTPTPTPTVSTGGGETEQVFAELEWFARSYRSTVDRFLSQAERALNLIRSLSRQSSVGRRDMRKLRRLLDEVEVLVYDRLGPHFDTEPTIRSFNDKNLAQIETLRKREDWQGVQKILENMATRYSVLATDAYARRTFPVDPIRGRFIRLLTLEGESDSVAVVATHIGTNYTETIRSAPPDDEVTLVGEREKDRTRYEEVFAPVEIAAYRTSHAYLTFNSLAFNREPRAIYLQQYENEQRSKSAVTRMLSKSGAVTAEGTETLGEQRWRQVFYRARNEVTYAHLLRTGRHVAVVAPSTTPWGDRPNGWPGSLSKSWLWG